MSIRSSTRLKNQLHNINFDLASPTFSEIQNIPSSNYKNDKSLKNKKIRKTNELFYFNIDSSEEQENNIVSNKINCKIKTQTPTVSAKKVSLCKNSNKLKEEHTEFLCTDLVPPEMANEQLKISNKGTDDREGRKIVKAKRLLRNKNCIIPDYNLKQDCEILIQNHVSLKLTSLKSENSMHNSDADQDYYAGPQGTGEQNESMEPQTVNNSFNLLVTTLPSPISPSENNFPLTTEESHFCFDSSKENLRPSTSGSVNDQSNKRRTYQLENSVINVSLLKSVSKRDSSRFNSKVNESIESNTPAHPKFSKVTLRRKWDKVNFDSSYLNNITPTNNATNSKSHMISLERTSTPMFMRKSTSFNKELLEQQEAKKSTIKKKVSKIKIPNFAAIHRNALNKIESISEYKERKENRAKMLLSGRKPTTETSIIKKESRKQLRFAPDTSNKDKSLTFIPLPSTPLPKRAFSVDLQSPITVKQSTHEKFQMIDLKDKTNIGLGRGQYKILEKKVSDKKIFQFKVQSSNTNIKEKAFSFQHDYICNTGKSNILQKNEIKTIITTKSKPVKNTVESRRGAIKGVRSNRRFELLMNMRKGK